MYTWDSFGSDIIEAFEKLGHTVDTAKYDRNEGNIRRDPSVQRKIQEKIKVSSPDIVFTFNYFPVIASACKEEDIKYVSWVYDCPVVLLYSYTVVFPTNYIFLFDSDTYLEFHNQGFTNFYYLPMAANPDRLLSMQDWDAFEKTKWNNQSDVAFIGSLYTEKHNFYERLSNITSYTRGYIEGIIEAQRQVYGYNFVESLLKPDIIEDMSKDLPLEPEADGVERKSWLFAQYVINRKITAIERQEMLSAIANTHSVDLYTPNEQIDIPGVYNHGPVDYYDYAPYVFKKAKVNLNISLRSIVNGIPLRCFDILGNGGFLFTNYQGDFEGLFTEGEDYVAFESMDDMIRKLDYYLNPVNEDERKAIAENGLARIREAHTYKHRIEEIMAIIAV